MGIKMSKKDIVITDYLKVKIPKDFALIKIGSYNVNLRNTINLDNKIKEIITYMANNYKNKTLDIVCLQGLYDTTSLLVLIRELKNYCLKHKLKTYLAPSFDNIEPSLSVSSGSGGIHDLKQMIELSFNGSNGSGGSGSGGSNGNNRSKVIKRKKLIQNIIISMHPIVSTIYAELDDKTDMDDVLGMQTVIGANILIGDNIISVYNTCLSKDIRSANIINSEVRLSELDTLMNIINKNKDSISGEKFKKYNKSEVHLVVGTININEDDDNGDSQEYTEFISNRRCIDIFRYLHNNDPGHTTSYKERLNYILMNLTDDIYDEKGKLYESFREIKSGDQLFNLIFKRYNIYFLDSYVITNDNNTSLIYYPIECIFIVKNKFQS